MTYCAVCSRLESDLSATPDVTLRNTDSERCLAIRSKKLFCVIENGRLHLKLSALRIEDLIGKKIGRRCRPSPDRAEWEWITVSSTEPQLRLLIAEALSFAGSIESAGLSRPWT